MKQIGRYQVTGDLGRGAMGVVYRAVDPAIGRTVAIKTIRLNELGDESSTQHLRDRLFREARSAGLLSHPNIVTIYDIAEIDGVAYIFMEFVDGPGLDSFVRADPPPSRDALLRLLSQVAVALDYAHGKGIIHRDIKPANILIHEGATAKIADFGVARIENHQATQAGMLVGTPTYMSPEQIQGDAVDGRSDQYSLGVIAYELLTGEKPFVAPSMPTLLFKIMRDTPTPVEHLNPSLTGAVGAAVQKALSKDRADRYPDCLSFTDALTAALREAPDWEPLTPGASLSLPTVVGTVDVPVPPVAPVETPVITPLTRTARLDEDEEPGRGRRWWLLLPAMLLFAILGVLLFRRLFREAPVPEATVGPTTEITKPEAAPAPVPPPPAATLPADAATQPPPAVKATAPPAPKQQNFQFVTTPAGANVTFDGDANLKCVTPCSVQLPVGPHRLTTQLEGFRPSFRRFTLPADSEVTLALEKPSGTLYVRSNPAGAQVFVDGQPQEGRTPVSLSLLAGPHEIRVVRDGSPPLNTNVIVRDQGLANLEVELPEATQ